MEPFLLPQIIGHSLLLCHSFQKYTGKSLIPGYQKMQTTEIAKALYYAPFVVVSHGTEADPIFNYANLAAQQLWEISWCDFIQMPSRYSAEALERAERSSLLEHVKKNGYVSDYTGVRVAATGQRFRILGTVLWNVTDVQGTYHGQAAMFQKWEYL